MAIATNSKPADMKTGSGELKGSLVTGQTSQGAELRATLLRLTRYQAVFEIYNASMTLRTSEVLHEFRIVLNDLTVYSGGAVISNLINTGPLIVCEVTLEEGGFRTASFAPLDDLQNVGADFSQFLRQWQKIYKVLPEFKVVVADMQTFLADLRLWAEQVELEIRAMPGGDRIEIEQEHVQAIAASLVPAFDAMHERLEAISECIDPELRPVHQNFSKRQLHPLVLCAPFAYRAFHKPLGYAGDYEMVNMIVRNPYEGASVFAKLVNSWFLSQWPARAHRNRIEFLRQMLSLESRLAAQQGHPMRVLDLACGPAQEVQQFLAEDDFCDRAEFTLLDFNEETVEHARGVFEKLKREHHRQTLIQVRKNSVQQVLKEGQKPSNGNRPSFDVIYCTGLFDYLSDHTCKLLLRILYDSVAPGGVLLVSNANDCKPFRHMLEFVLDWHLIYRDNKRLLSLAPPDAPPEGARLIQDPTGVNMFLELRKGRHA
jgi:extracellular factor (EF) 3-hydroxypalmitic acid methyl ester biosynthesis protein